MEKGQNKVRPNGQGRRRVHFNIDSWMPTRVVRHWGSREHRRFIELIAVTYELYRAGRGTLVVQSVQLIEDDLRMTENSVRYWELKVLTDGRQYMLVAVSQMWWEGGKALGLW